jgi:hypothetical protein
MTAGGIFLTVTWIGLLVVLTLVAQRILDLYYGHVSKRWPYVLGKLTGARIRRFYDRFSPCEAMLSYEYTLHGRQYSGARVIFGRYIGDGRSILAVMQYFLRKTLAPGRFIPGVEVEFAEVLKGDILDEAKIFYDPQYPLRSVLVPGVLPRHYVKLIGGLLLAGLLIRLLCFLIFEV